MIGLGQLSLLFAFTASGYAALSCLVGVGAGREDFCRVGRRAGFASVVALSICLGVLAWALVTRDFGLLYVRQYSSRLLPWYFCLSALWVGQAGSLLLWAWMLGVLSGGFLIAGRRVEPRGCRGRTCHRPRVRATDGLPLLSHRDDGIRGESAGAQY